MVIWLLESEWQQQRCCNIWQRIAAHYANDTIVIGYDLLNEPIAPYEAEKLDELNAALEPLYMRITKAIRKVDQNHIVMLGGAQWNGNFKVFKDSKFDDKMMYTCHRYWCDTIALHLADFVHFRDSVNLPMYMGETGENAEHRLDLLALQEDERHQLHEADQDARELGTHPCVCGSRPWFVQEDSRQQSCSGCCQGCDERIARKR